MLKYHTFSDISAHFSRFCWFWAFLLQASSKPVQAGGYFVITNQLQITICHRRLAQFSNWKENREKMKQNKKQLEEQ
jgi:hypothetical protein